MLQMAKCCKQTKNMNTEKSNKRKEQMPIKETTKHVCESGGRCGNQKHINSKTQENMMKVHATK